MASTEAADDRTSAPAFKHKTNRYTVREDEKAADQVAVWDNIAQCVVGMALPTEAPRFRDRLNSERHLCVATAEAAATVDQRARAASGIVIHARVVADHFEKHGWTSELEHLIRELARSIDKADARGL